MESVKKIIPFILIAVIFAVGGYVVGKGSVSNQGASLYTAATTTATIAKPTGLGTTGPTGGDTPLLSVVNTNLPPQWKLAYGSDGCIYVLTGQAGQGGSWTKVWCDSAIQSNTINAKN